MNPEALRRLYHIGRIERVARGLYRLPDGEVGEHHSLVEASLMAPNGIICLLSALRFHGLTTQAPFEVWIALEARARRPLDGTVSLRIIRMSGAAIEEGIEEHSIENVHVRVFGIAKTIADCFKFRNKIGIDVAIEALRECRRERRCTMDDLWRYAKICRVTNVMRPYLESVA